MKRLFMDLYSFETSRFNCNRREALFQDISVSENPECNTLGPRDLELPRLRQSRQCFQCFSAKIVNV